MHLGCIELIFHQQQAGLFVGITTGPVVVGIRHNALQQSQRVSFHREGGHHWVVVHCVEGRQGRFELIGLELFGFERLGLNCSEALALTKCPGGCGLLLFPGH